MDETDKKPRTIPFKIFLIEIIIVVFFTLTWLSPLLFAFGSFNIWYFLFLFIAIIISAIILLYVKAIPEVSISKNPAQHFANVLKIMADIIVTNLVGGNEHPQVKDIKDVMQKALIWSLREGLISPEFNQKVLGEAEIYILNKLFPEKEIEEEQK